MSSLILDIFDGAEIIFISCCNSKEIEMEQRRWQEEGMERKGEVRLDVLLKVIMLIRVSL